MSDELTELPEGWELVNIKDVTLPYATAQPTKEPDKQFHYIDIGSIDNSYQAIAEPKTFLGKDAPSRARRVVKTNDVLFSTVRTYLKNIACVPAELDGVLTSTGIAVLRAASGLDSKFLFHWVASDTFIERISSAMDGTLYPAVTDSDVANAQIPLPPLNEQKRIVAKIEELHDRLHRSKQALEAVPELCDRFRQSVLAAAFRGDLTADWREQNPDVEPALEFLEFERDRNGWAVVKAQDACLSVQSGSTPKDKPFTETGEIPFLKVYNIVNQKVDFDYRPQYISREIHQKALKRSITLPNDVLINIVGPPLGKVALVTDQFQEWNINQALVVFRPKEGLLSKYLYYFLREGAFVRDIIVETKGIVGQVNISLTQCRNCLIKVPSREEQLEIVYRVENLLAIADTLASSMDIATKNLDRLNQSILAKAFRGELVEQDPNDEPASVLLDRIRAERQAQEGKKSRGARGKRKKANNDQLDLPGVE